jgi:hypothetical protein
MDIWPQLPIATTGEYGMSRPWDTKNMSAAFKQHNRVCQIDFWYIPNSLLKNLEVIKEPFPILRKLWLKAGHKNVTILRDAFMGGSAPRLQDVRFEGVSFPGRGGPYNDRLTHDMVCCTASMARSVSQNTTVKR